MAKAREVTGRWLNFDDARTEVGEGTTAVRSGEHAREIEDDEVVERAESGGVAGFHVTIMADGAGLCAGGDI